MFSVSFSIRFRFRSRPLYDRQIILEGAESVVLGCIRYVTDKSKIKSESTVLIGLQRVTRSAKKSNTMNRTPLRPVSD